VFVNSNLIPNRTAQQFTGVLPSYYNGSDGRALGNNDGGGGGGGEGASSSADCPDGRLPAASRALLHFCGDLHLEMLNLTVEGVQLIQDIKPSRDPITLNISSPVVLFGSNNSHLTVNIHRAHIVNNAAHAALLVHGSSTTQVNITNMLCRGNLGQSGACLAVAGAAVVRLSNSVIDNCTAVRGAGLFVSGTADVGIDNCTFSHCVGSAAGGALQVRDRAVLDITNSNFKSNRVASLDGVSGRGGAVAVVNDSTATAYKSRWQNNSAAHSGGAVLVLDQASFDVSNSTFLLNMAANYSRTGGFGGALAAAGKGAMVKANGVSFNNNTSANSGGAVLVADQALFDISNCTFSNNNAATHDRSDGYGGALAAQGNGTIVKANGVLFDNNTSANSGGAVDLAHQASFFIINCTFSSNTAANGSRTGGFGGALAVEHSKDVTVVNTVFDTNSAATFGGAVFATGNVIFGIMDSNFSSNRVFHQSTEGGAGGALSVYKNVTVSVFRSLFFNNTAAGAGGAISGNVKGGSLLSLLRSGDSNGLGAGDAEEQVLACVVSMQHCSFLRNSAEHEGGAFKVVSSNLTVLNSTMFKNGCTGRGAAGGVLNMYGTSLKPVHVKFTNNSISNSTADAGGAVMAKVELDSSAADSTCQGNEGGVTHGTVDNNSTRWGLEEGGSSTVSQCVTSTLDWLNVTISGSTAYLGQEMVLEGRLLRVNITGSSNLMLNSSAVLRKGGRCMMGDKALTAAGVCELCPEHMYSLDYSDPAPQTCTPCPLHATCKGGPVVLANDNFFNTFNTSNKCSSSDINR
jgi:predicted outer membrane repeat protein